MYVFFNKPSKELKNNFANWEDLELWKVEKIEKNVNKNILTFLRMLECYFIV